MEISQLKLIKIQPNLKLKLTSTQKTEKIKTKNGKNQKWKNQKQANPNGNISAQTQQNSTKLET